MYHFPVTYHEPVFRPPSEANSFLLQVTIGCSNNKCTYCDMYRSKQYKVRDLDSILREIDSVSDYFKTIGYSPKRFFLCDGDALGAPMNILVPVLERINLKFPKIERVGIYATAQNMLEKTTNELKLLSNLKLNMAYLGLESGNDKVLHMVVKGNTQSEMIEGSLKLKESGFQLSSIAMLGLGGRKLSKDHIIDTAKVISITSPQYFSFLTTMALPGTPFYKMVQRNNFEALTTKELLIEMRDILSLIKPQFNSITFRANHVSNQYPLGGEIPVDTAQLITVLNSWIDLTPTGTYPPMPSSM